MNFMGKSLGETRENLVHAFQLYGECLELGQSLNGYFRPLIFAKFVVASLHLCVLCFVLSTNLMEPAMLFYVFFTVAILGQVSIYCFCGSSVKEESQQFAQAIYESSWQQLLQDDVKVARSLQFAMMRAQRGCRIDGYFFEANRQTLILVGGEHHINYIIYLLILNTASLFCSLPDCAQCHFICGPSQIARLAKPASIHTLFRTCSGLCKPGNIYNYALSQRCYNELAN